MADVKMFPQMSSGSIKPLATEESQSASCKKVRRNASRAARAGGVRHGSTSSAEWTTTILGFHAHATRCPSTYVG